MTDIFYEVRGVNDPIDGEVLKFASKKEAEDYYESIKDKYPEASIFGVEFYNDDYDHYERGEEFPVGGYAFEQECKNNPEWNSCTFDDSDNFDDEGNFRLGYKKDPEEDEECKEVSFTKDDLVEDTHAQTAKPAGDPVASYNNALKYAKKDNKPYLYGYTDVNGKFFALDHPIPWKIGGETEFRRQYKKCMTVSVAYPDKSFVESKKEYDFKKMREALREFEAQSHFSVKKEDFKQCTGAVCKDSSAQCCMCGKIHLVKDLTEVGDGQWKCHDCEKDNKGLIADGAEIECEKNKVITHSADEMLKEDLDADLDKYNQYINFLKAQLRQDEETLEKAKKQGDGNEFAVKVMEKRVQADKDDLESALPKMVKDNSADLNAEDADKVDLTDNSENIDHEDDKKEGASEDDRLELSED